MKQLLADGRVAWLSDALSAQQWPHYARRSAASHYSPLEQITAANVNKLAIAWEWKPNEKNLPQFGTRPGAFQNTPLVIDCVMYLSTPCIPGGRARSDTGKELWRYDPKAYEDGQPPNGQGFAHRGVVAWRDRSQQWQ
jgi:quinoprotein glucose dehydrogenase